MTKDIQPIIDGWEFEPGNVCVRIVRGKDGREKVQMRIDLGLMQMEMDGRPDGARPQGSESLLDHLEEKVKGSQGKKQSRELQLTDDDCAELLREGLQYYYRYLSFFHLGRYDLADRDTRRNLRLFAFVREHAASEEIKWRFDQYRPYVTMMNTRARATPLYESKHYREALEIVEQGIKGILDFLAEHELEEQAEQCIELAFLKQWKDEIDQSRPLDQSEKLRRLLDQAIRSEDYERAAQLRDELRKISPS